MIEIIREFQKAAKRLVGQPARYQPYEQGTVPDPGPKRQGTIIELRTDSGLLYFKILPDPPGMLPVIIPADRVWLKTDLEEHTVWERAKGGVAEPTAKVDVASLPKQE